MATPENRVKAVIKDILKSNGIYYAMPMGTGYGKGERRALDAVEMGTTTALQDREIATIKAAGGAALIINENNFNDLLSTIILLQQRR